MQECTPLIVMGQELLLEIPQENENTYLQELMIAQFIHLPYHNQQECCINIMLPHIVETFFIAPTFIYYL